MYVWQQLVAEVLAIVGSPSAFGGIIVYGLIHGGVLLSGIGLLVGAYASLREFEIGLKPLSTSDLPIIGVAVLTPLVLVGLTKLVGIVTNVPYTSLTKTSVAANPPLGPILAILGLGLLVGVPTLVLICQILIQGSFCQAVGADGAIVLTTLTTGFVMTSNTGGLATIPELGKLLGLIVFVLLLGVALLGAEKAERRWLRYLAATPIVIFAVIVVLSGVSQIESIAGGLFAATQLTVLGIAAYTYDRSNSLLAPTLAYVSLLLANRTVVVLEAGM